MRKVKLLLFESKRWKKTHVQFDNFLGATACRTAVMAQAEHTRVLGRQGRPTCKLCIEVLPIMRRAIRRLNKK